MSIKQKLFGRMSLSCDHCKESYSLKRPPDDYFPVCETCYLGYIVHGTIDYKKFKKRHKAFHRNIIDDYKIKSLHYPNDWDKVPGRKNIISSPVFQTAQLKECFICNNGNYDIQYHLCGGCIRPRNSHVDFFTPAIIMYGWEKGGNSKSYLKCGEIFKCSGCHGAIITYNKSAIIDHSSTTEYQVGEYNKEETIWYKTGSREKQSEFRCEKKLLGSSVSDCQHRTEHTVFNSSLIAYPKNCNWQYIQATAQTDPNKYKRLTEFRLTLEETAWSHEKLNMLILRNFKINRCSICGELSVAYEKVH